MWRVQWWKKYSFTINEIIPDKKTRIINVNKNLFLLVGNLLDLEILSLAEINKGINRVIYSHWSTELYTNNLIKK